MEPASIQTLGALFFWNVERFPTDRLLAHGRATYSTAAFEKAVLGLACWFSRSGLVPGDRVALYCDNRPEWHIIDFAVHLAGLVLVPIYPTLAVHQMEQLLAHAGARAVFCGEEQLTRVESVRGSLPELAFVLAVFPLPSADVTSEDRAALRERTFAEDPATLATIVYTSGTTGTPKGVMLSHRNIVFDVKASLKRLPDERPVRLALSVLPLSHVFERVLGYGYFWRGIPIAYGDPHDLRDLLKAYHPTLLGAVPRILEKIREAVEKEIAKMPAHRRRISQVLLSAGYAKLDRTGGWREALYPVAERLMFRKIHRQLGDVEAFVVGGAWLNPELERYFRALGFIVLQGYGLTETAPVVTFNTYGGECVGSVGQAIDGVEMKLSDDGEILVRGPNVMMGYYRDPEATAKVIRDGWFSTGDLGRISPEGFLTITGRRKEMLLLSNGKNIYYAPIEQALCACPYIEHAFIVGEGRNYTAAILIPNMLALRRYAATESIACPAGQELLLLPPILKLYRDNLNALQSEFSRFEQAKRFCFLHEEALLDLDLVTPTQKIRRNVLERKYSASIERLYQQDEPFLIPNS